MKKNFTRTFALCATCLFPSLWKAPEMGRLFSQNVSINNTGNPADPSALLDIDASPGNNKGLLVPRVTLTSSTDAVTIQNPATSLLVYNLGTGGLSPAGYYYNTGTSASPAWVQLLHSGTFGSSGSAWMLTGNTGTAWNTNFLGTTDNVSLRFKTNNTEKMIIDSSGYVGIGATRPIGKLQIYNGRLITQPNTATWWGPATNVYDAIDVWGAIYTSNQNAAISIHAQGPTDVAQWTSRYFLKSNSDGTPRSGIEFIMRNSSNEVISAKEIISCRADGNVGIGNTNPAYKLVVSDSGGTNGIGASIAISNPSKTASAGVRAPTWVIYNMGDDGTAPTSYPNSLQFWSYTPGGNSRLTLADNGNVGIGTGSAVTPSYKLQVNGSVAGVGSFNNISDRRYKKNIVKIDGGLTKILQLEGVSYDWRSEDFPDINFDNRKQLGLIGQDVERILPEAISIDGAGYYSVSYSTLIPVLVEAIKDLKAENDSLKLENVNLKAATQQQEIRIKRLEDLMGQ